MLSEQLYNGVRERRGGDCKTGHSRARLPKYVCIICIFPPAELTHVSSVVRASAAFPSPWMDSMAVE